MESTSPEINKETIDELMKNPGRCIGELVKSTFVYIKKSKGQEALKRLEKEMEDLGYPIDFKKIKPLDWYPIGLRSLTFIALRRAFEWKDKDIKELGENSLNYSIIFKLFLKFFVSLENAFKHAAKYWKKHFDFGEMEPCQFNKKEKYTIVRLHGFEVHPDSCLHLFGYLKKLAELCGKKNVKVEETKCIYRGDPYHEYKISWD